MAQHILNTSWKPGRYAITSGYCKQIRPELLIEGMTPHASTFSDFQTTDLYFEEGDIFLIDHWQPIDGIPYFSGALRKGTYNPEKPFENIYDAWVSDADLNTKFQTSPYTPHNPEPAIYVFNLDTCIINWLTANLYTFANLLQCSNVIMNKIREAGFYYTFDQLNTMDIRQYYQSDIVINSDKITSIIGLQLLKNLNSVIRDFEFSNSFFTGQSSLFSGNTFTDQNYEYPDYTLKPELPDYEIIKKIYILLVVGGVEAISAPFDCIFGVSLPPENRSNVEKVFTINYKLPDSLLKKSDDLLKQVCDKFNVSYYPNVYPNVIPDVPDLPIQPDPTVLPPILTTKTVEGIIGNGNAGFIAELKNSFPTIIRKGFVYGQSPVNTNLIPTVIDYNHLPAGNLYHFLDLSSVFDCTLYNLTPGTYYIRAYVETSAGYIWGNEITFTIATSNTGGGGTNGSGNTGGEDGNSGNGGNNDFHPTDPLPPTSPVPQPTPETKTNPLTWIAIGLGIWRLLI